MQQQQPQTQSQPEKVETPAQSQPTMDWEQMEEVAKEEDQILAQEMQKASITPSQSPSISALKSNTAIEDDFGEDGEPGELTFEKDDPREHLNIVFIGHVGRCLFRDTEFELVCETSEDQHFSFVFVFLFNYLIFRCWKIYNQWKYFVYDWNGRRKNNSKI